MEREFEYTDVVEAPLDIASDGFLAVNSLFASCVLLIRAYRLAAGCIESLPPTFEGLVQTTDAFRSVDNDRQGWLEAVKGRTISLIYSTGLAAAAADLESRFVEGALGNLHVADWRNFGHGRHHWLAKRADTTAVIGFVAAEDEFLARRTLKLLPDAIPARSATFNGAPDVQALCALLFALQLADLAGEAVGVDPGRPGVPEFGRKLYHLGPQVRRPSDRAAAERRKARARQEPVSRTHRTAFEKICGQLAEANAIGIVFDYDGTLCDRRGRFEPLTPPMQAALAQLAAQGALIGVATGRGRSAGVALQQAIPEPLRRQVLIGYYNGSLIAPLSCLPTDAELVPTEASTKIGAALMGRWPSANIEIRHSQVTLNLPINDLPERLVGMISELAWEIDPVARVLCSAHSVDIVLGGAGKSAVVDAVRQLAQNPGGGVLRFGDKGRWPGNDVDLLADPLGISVDEVSEDLDSCWNLSPAGILGPQATLYYLNRIAPDARGRLRLSC